jgi:hypothetical protein
MDADRVMVAFARFGLTGRRDRLPMPRSAMDRGARTPTSADTAATGLRRMGETPKEHAPAYHLLLEQPEVAAAASALRLFISDEAHQPHIRELAREVFDALDGEPDAEGVLTVSLSAEQLKVTYSAIKLLFNDLQREQAEERETLRAILDKLPDEHSIRAISLP